MKMLHLVMFLCLFHVSCSKPPKDQKKEEDLNFVRKILQKIEDFLSFLCNRCVQIILRIDKSIEKQEFLNVARKYCVKMIKSSTLQNICVNVTEDILREVYKQLKRFEPNPSLCSHLRLCDSCSPNITIKPRELPEIRSIEEGIPHFLPIFAKISLISDILQEDSKEN